MYITYNTVCMCEWCESLKRTVHLNVSLHTQSKEYTLKRFVHSTMHEMERNAENKAYLSLKKGAVWCLWCFRSGVRTSSIQCGISGTGKLPFTVYTDRFVQGIIGTGYIFAILFNYESVVSSVYLCHWIAKVFMSPSLWLACWISRTQHIALLTLNKITSAVVKCLLVLPQRLGQRLHDLLEYCLWKCTVAFDKITLLLSQ